MEKRIKTLYVITIIAILSFMGMQTYWLYVRYEYSLDEYERHLADRVAQCVQEYKHILKTTSPRDVDSGRNDSLGAITIPHFQLSQHYGDTVRTTRTAKLLIYSYSAYELLGVAPDTPLTDEQKHIAYKLAVNKIAAPTDSIVYDASGARDENEAWTAIQYVQSERKNPFTAQGLDSVLAKAGIAAEIDIERADSMVWNDVVRYHNSVFAPELFVSRPYSPLEGRIVNITCPINPFSILPGMFSTLIIVAVVSVLLTVCLVLQFSTVLKLKRLDRMRNGFITTMIHELKRPVSTLKMCVSGLENERMMADDDTKQEIFAQTRDALDNLSAYFSRLRDITFNNVEQIPLNIMSVSPHAIFDSVIDATHIPSDKIVKFTNSIDTSLIVSADQTHLFNILNNLVENAIKYSGKEVEIKASATVHDDTVEISISDNGNGVPSRDLPHIFTRFYRGKASAGNLPGIGLGLTYVRLLVEAHGGSVDVTSTVGKGSCFTITLPQ